MQYLGLEFYKLKRRHVFLTVLALFLAETFFILYSAYRSVARGGTAADLPWENLLMQIALLNGLFCPFTLAVAASRVCDVEHKGDTWKLLSCCSERMSSLYSAKFACCMILTAAAQAIQYFLYAGYGFAAKYPGAFPAEKFLASYAGTMLINVGVLAVQEFFSMAVANQSAALVAGLFGSFLGFAGALFPDSVRRIFIWGYYTELAQARTVEINGKWALAPVAVNWEFLAGVFIAGLLIYGIGKHRFAQKEL